MGLFYLSWFASSVVFTGIYAFNLYWRYALFIPSGLVLLESLLLGYILESPRFLLTNAVDVEAATKVIKKISVINGEGDFSYTLMSENTRNRGLSLRDIIHSRLTVLQLVTCSVIWMISLVTYYEIVYMMPSFIENSYWKYIVFHLFEIVSVVIFMELMEKFGRKKTTVLVFLLIGLIFLTIYLLEYFMNQGSVMVWKTVLLMISRNILSGEFYLIYVHTMEIFPTRIRGTAFGICNLAGRCAAMPFLSQIVIFGLIEKPVILGGIMILTAGLAITLEETLEKETEEVIGQSKHPLLTSSTNLNS